MSDNQTSYWSQLNDVEKGYIEKIFTDTTTGRKLPEDVKKMNKEDFWKYLLLYLNGTSPIDNTSIQDNSFGDAIRDQIDEQYIGQDTDEQGNKIGYSFWNDSVQTLLNRLSGILESELTKDNITDAYEETLKLLYVFSKFADAADNPSSEEWVFPYLNKNQNSYSKKRNVDLIRNAAVISEKIDTEIQFTNRDKVKVKVKNENGDEVTDENGNFVYEIKDEKPDFWMNLLMPMYKRNVEVEDLDKNFWVISQVLSAIADYIFDPKNGLSAQLADMIKEIAQLWDNVLLLWVGLAKKSEISEDVYFEVIYLNQQSAYNFNMKYDNFDHDEGYYFGVNGVEEENEEKKFKDNIFKECERVIRLNPQSRMVIIPVIRTGNYKKNYYNCEYWPGIVVHNPKKDESNGGSDPPENWFRPFITSKKEGQEEITFAEAIYKEKETSKQVMNKGIYINLTMPELQKQVMGFQENELDYNYTEKLSNTRLRKGSPVYYGLIRTIFDIAETEQNDTTEQNSATKYYSFELKLEDPVRKDLKKGQVLLDGIKALKSKPYTWKDLITYNPSAKIEFLLEKAAQQNDSQDQQQESISYNTTTLKEKSYGIKNQNEYQYFDNLDELKTHITNNIMDNSDNNIEEIVFSLNGNEQNFKNFISEYSSETALFDKAPFDKIGIEKATLFIYGENLTIDNSFFTGKDEDFEKINNIKIDLSEYTGTIGDNCFENMPKINEVVMPKASPRLEQKVSFGKEVFSVEENVDSSTIEYIEINDNISIDKDFFENRNFKLVEIKSDLLSNKDIYSEKLKTYIENPNSGIEEIKFSIGSELSFQNQKGTFGYYQGELISSWKFVEQEKIPVNNYFNDGLYFLLDKNVLDSVTGWIAGDTKINGYTSNNSDGINNKSNSFLPYTGIHGALQEAQKDDIKSPTIRLSPRVDLIANFLWTLKNSSVFSEVLNTFFNNYFENDPNNDRIIEAIALYYGANDILTNNNNDFFYRVRLHQEKWETYYPFVTESSRWYWPDLSLEDKKVYIIEKKLYDQSKSESVAFERLDKTDKGYSLLLSLGNNKTPGKIIEYNFKISTEDSSGIDIFRKEWGISSEQIDDKIKYTHSGSENFIKINESDIPTYLAEIIILISTLIIVGESVIINFFNFIPIGRPNLEAIIKKEDSDNEDFILQRELNNKSFYTIYSIGDPSTEYENGQVARGPYPGVYDESLNFLGKKVFSYNKLLRDRENQLLELAAECLSQDIKAKEFSCYLLSHFQEDTRVNFNWTDLSDDALFLPKKTLIFIKNPFSEKLIPIFLEEEKNKDKFFKIKKEEIDELFQIDSKETEDEKIYDDISKKVSLWCLSSENEELDKEINWNKINKSTDEMYYYLYFSLQQRDGVYYLKFNYNNNFIKTNDFSLKDYNNNDLSLIYEQGVKKRFPFQLHANNYDRKGLVIKTPLGGKISIPNTGTVKSDPNTKGLADAWYSGNDGHSGPHNNASEVFASSRIFIDERDYELGENNWLLEIIDYDSYNFDKNYDFSYLITKPDELTAYPSGGIVTNGKIDFDKLQKALTTDFSLNSSSPKWKNPMDLFQQINPLVEFYYDLSTDIYRGRLTLDELFNSDLETIKGIAEYLKNKQMDISTSDKRYWYYDPTEKGSDNWTVQKYRLDDYLWKNDKDQWFINLGTATYYWIWKQHIQKYYIKDINSEIYYLKDEYVDVDKNGNKVKIPWPLFDDEGKQVIGRLGMLTSVMVRLIAPPIEKNEDSKIVHYDLYKFDTRDVTGGAGLYTAIFNIGYQEDNKSLSQQLTPIKESSQLNGKDKEKIYYRGQQIPAYKPEDEASFTLKNKKEYKGNKYILFSQNNFMIENSYNGAEEYSYDFAAFPSNGKYEKYVPHWSFASNSDSGINGMLIDGLVSENAHLPEDFRKDNLLNEDDFGEMIGDFKLTFKEVFPDATYYSDNVFYENGDRKVNENGKG